MSKVTLHHGDNRVVLREMKEQGVRFHLVATDPPYGLKSIQKRFGKEGSAPAQYGTDGAFARQSAGFMGNKWDGTGIERDPEFWRLVYDVMVPGGYLVAFSGSRTGHRVACAIEDAGFIMHPFKGWVFGQGMPKASNAQRAIDCHLCTLPGRHYESVLPRDARPGDHICPETEEGLAWAGWGYGTQADKPALEPIYIAQRPFAEKNGALNFLRHGAGAINIDGCRVPTSDKLGGGAYSAIQKDRKGEWQNRQRDCGKGSGYVNGGIGDYVQPNGRHPANLLHDGSPDVIDMFPQTSSGTGAIKRSSSRDADGNTGSTFGAENRPDGTEMISYGDRGSAARFFNSFGYSSAEQIMMMFGCSWTEANNFHEYLLLHHTPEIDPICYQAKATGADRAGVKHPTVKPVTLMRWLCRMYTPVGGSILDPFAGSGTTGQAALDEGFDCVLIEAEDSYAAGIRDRFDLETDRFYPIENKIFPTDEKSCSMRTNREHCDSLPPDLAALIDGAPGLDFAELIG